MGLNHPIIVQISFNEEGSNPDMVWGAGLDHGAAMVINIDKEPIDCTLNGLMRSSRSARCTEYHKIEEGCNKWERKSAFSSRRQCCNFSPLSLATRARKTETQ